ncbi:alpha-hydroxy acid oxidase [Aliikangiella maris]|uniref:Alpha-hydroxy acid oxidase n=2 Tax=Aliikangiella maris TaxID=3162458 RepID=A0ABV3MLD9_9GAMM
MNQYTQKLSNIPPEICSVSDYERQAKDMVEKDIWAYIDSGSGDEICKNNNLNAFSSYQIWNRVLRNLSQGNTRCTFADVTLPHPIILGPVAHQKLTDPDGELATSQAAAATDSIMVVSTLASYSLEKIAECSSQYNWFQLYWQGNRQNTLALLQRAINANYQAVVITVDVPVNGLRRRIQRSGFSMPLEASAANIQTPPQPNIYADWQSEIFQGWMANAPQWDDIAWLISQSQLPVYIKGILHPHDAKMAQEIGATGIIVSNHGGRALDCAPSPLSVLPLIRQQTGKDFPVLLDSGIRQGSDIFKAIALGANAVLIGRPQLFGLIVAGALGVAHIIKLLRQELEVTMALAGCATLADIDQTCLVHPR